MPGAPPVMLLSVAVIFATPFSRNEIVLPTASPPAGSRPPAARCYTCCQLVQLPAGRLNSISSGLPEFQ